MDVGATNAAGTDGGLRVKISFQATYETEKRTTLFFKQVHKCDCKEDTELADILSAVCKHMQPAANVSHFDWHISQGLDLI